ncbi:putative single-stranded DNA binding protein [Bacillus phage SWEP1]|nr:putative single-stranded DNA binding protein [Bacillus phage SWEP1]
MSNKQALFINRLVIAQTKIMGLVEEVAAGLDIDSEQGQDRVADRFNTIIFNLEEAYDTVIPEDLPEEDKPQTFDEFIDEFMEEFDYTGEAKEAARQILISAIDELKRKGGGYTLSGGLKNGTPTMFKLTVNRGTIRIELGDEGFVFEEVKEDDSFFGGSVEDDDYEAGDDYEEEDEESYQHEDEDEEEDGRCDCPMCDGSWEEEVVEEHVHDEVDNILSYISSDIDELERVIGNYFGNEKLGASSYELTADDYALIRIYLIHVIEADRDEVNKLTDRGLLAAWNYHLYIKNNQ